MRTPRTSLRLAAVLATSLGALAARGDPPASLRANPAAVMKPPSCTIPGARDWREYRSAHFAVATDVPRDRAAALVKQFEELRAYVVAALFGPDVEVPGRLRAVAFASTARFAEFAPKDATRLVVNDGWETTVVFAIDGLAATAPTLAHELARDVAWRQFPRQPRWFTEGLATFVESVADERQPPAPAAPAAAKPTTPAATNGQAPPVQPEPSGRWAGHVSPTVARLLGGSLAPRPKELLEWRGSIDGDPPRFQARSWLLYHYLWNNRSKAFSQYQDLLAKSDDPAVAWRMAFQALDPANDEAMSRLDADLGAYLKEGKYASYRVEIGAVDAAFQDAPIPSQDLHMLLARARTAGRPGEDPASKEAARANLDEALREDPLQPEALAGRAAASGGSVAAALRPVTVARPDDARAWLLLAEALDATADAKDQEAALRKAAALAPDSARASADLAAVLVASGRAREARPFAQRAVDLAPWNGDAVQTLAAVALELRQCSPALVLQRRAVDLLAPDDPAGVPVRERLAVYEARCRAGGSAPPSR